MDNDDILAAVWREQSVWSKRAGLLKADITRWRTVVLASLTLGAVLETLAIQFGSRSVAQQALSWAGAAALAAVPVVRATKVNRDGIVNWTRARSASEAIKQEVYTYVTGTAHYRDAATKAERLRAAVDGFLDEVQDLAIFAASVEATERPPPPPLDVAEYLDVRVSSQIDNYYRPRAQELAIRAERFRSAELGLGIAAAVIGTGAAVLGSPTLSGWVAVATTVSGALVAHREASRYEHLVISYSTTARRLERLRGTFLARMARAPLGPREEDELVAQCEEAISVENQAWMTSWSRPAVS